MSKDVSRRDFLKGAALSALGLGLMGGSALAEGMPEGGPEGMPAGGPPPMMGGPAILYNPGTYQSEQTTGFATVLVTVTFSESEIVDVAYEVTKTSDQDFFPQFEDGMKSLCAQIVEKQSAGMDVDVVSGATLCSEAIKNGVNDCIVQAGGTVEGLVTDYTVWRNKPEDIDESLIADAGEYDVAVLGNGYSGAAAVLKLTELGYKVLVVETQKEESFNLLGGDEGCVNSKYVQEHYGAPEVDPVEFYNNWMLNCQNYANPGLVMKFAKYGGDALDWHISRYLEQGGDTSRWNVQFYFENEGEGDHVLEEIGAYKFYKPTLRPEQGGVAKVNRAYCVSQGTEYRWNCHAERLVQDETGAITSVIYIDNETEQYYRAKVKAVVIATGGFGSNTMMKNDLLSDIMYNKQAQDTSAGMGMRDGSGVKMAVWAGARIEENPPTMDGRQTWLNSRPAAPSYGYPQGIFMDYTGQRFMNEFWGPIEHRGFPTFYMNRELMFALYDDTLPERLEYVACSHGSTQPSASHLASIREKMNEAYANKGTLTNIGDLSVYAGDTLEECLGYAGITDAKVIANMKKAVESYNACCAAGKDTEFGRDPKLLFPIEKGPFYLQVSAGDATIGNLMATMGALWTDSEQRVLGENWKPIPGLFATGNTVSGRFGRDYFTPLMGVSIGIAVCLGREAGMSVDRWMKDELV